MMNQYQSINVTVGDTLIMPLWSRGKGVGWQIGLKLKIPDRNIHLTVYSRNDVLNAHVTDTTVKERIWEDVKTKDELEKIALEFRNKCIKSYGPNDTFLEFDGCLFSPFISPHLDKKGNMFHDIGPMLVKTESEDIIKKSNISEAYKRGFAIGVIRKLWGEYLVIPVEKDKMLYLNSNIKRTPLWKLPPCRGVFELIKYIEKSKVLEESPHFNEDRLKEVELAMTGYVANVCRIADIKND